MKMMIAGILLLLAGVAAGEEPPGARHLIYLHGRIIQVRQDARPEHPEFGPYEMEMILEAFREQGFTVTGEIRPREATVSEAADHVVDQVRNLLDAGVPANDVIVVGGSMGAGIALVAAERLGNPDLRFVVLGTCLSGTVDRLRERGGPGPAGRILAFREKSDTLTEGCAAWAGDDEAHPLVDAREVELDTGLGHGFLYRPLREWMGPLLEWLN